MVRDIIAINDINKALLLDSGEDGENFVIAW